MSALRYSLKQTSGLGALRLTGVRAFEIRPDVYWIGANCKAKRLPEGVDIMMTGAWGQGLRGDGIMLLLDSGAHWELLIYTDVVSTRCLVEFRYGPSFVVFPLPDSSHPGARLKRIEGHRKEF